MDKLSIAKEGIGVSPVSVARMGIITRTVEIIRTITKRIAAKMPRRFINYKVKF